MSVDDVRTLAMKLSRDERELLGIELLSTLESVENQPEVDAAWAEEILKRSSAFRAGQAQTHDAAGTSDRLRQRLATGNAS